MSYSLSPKEFHTVAGLGAEDRFDYFVEAVAESRQVWTLGRDEGTVLLSFEGDDCLPVWPHPDFAEQWVSGDWSDCRPLSIDMSAWLERWLPGLQRDGVALAVFPSTEEEGMVIEPEELKETLNANR